MNFNTHIELIKKKAKGALQFVKRQSHFFDMDIIKILYTSLVRSNLEFACSIWSPHQKEKKISCESTQKQMVIFMKGDHLNRSENNYILSPYIDRCKSVGLDTLVRRRINLSVLLIHSIIIGKFQSPSLRSKMDLNTGTRSLRNPEFIRLKFAKTDFSTYSPLNNACRMFNHAALFIDPTIPHYAFRKKLLALPDSAFGQWSQF